MGAARGARQVGPSLTAAFLWPGGGNGSGKASWPQRCDDSGWRRRSQCQRHCHYPCARGIRRAGDGRPDGSRWQAGADSMRAAAVGEGNGCCRGCCWCSVVRPKHRVAIVETTRVLCSFIEKLISTSSDQLRAVLMAVPSNSEATTRLSLRPASHRVQYPPLLVVTSKPGNAALTASAERSCRGSPTHGKPFEYPKISIVRVAVSCLIRPPPSTS
jgi:hypothetical protein